MPSLDSPVHVLDSALFKDMFGTAEMRAVFGDRASVQYWLDAEAALAYAQARVGLIPAEAAEEIARHARVEEIDLDELKAGTELVGYPILPLVRQLSSRCQGEAGRFVHWGATTQDIMDTANSLQLKAARTLFLRDLRRLAHNVERLARAHRDTVMAGRTHGQQALPVTFGYKAAVWLAELRRHRERFEEVGKRCELVEFAGAAGTLASVGENGLAVQERMAQRLGLRVPSISWHTSRDGLAEFVSLVALLASTLGKIAQEVALLQRTEIGELEEAYQPGKGGSSTMPQKRNPILCEAILGISKAVRQLVPTMLDAMQHDNERATGPWHAEWVALPEACVLGHGALQKGIELLDGLVVRPAAMRRNLELSGGLIVSEAVMMALAEHLGRQRAHDLVYEASMRAIERGRSLRDELLAEPNVAAQLSGEELDRLLDPANYAGLSAVFVDRVLEAS